MSLPADTYLSLAPRFSEVLCRVPNHETASAVYRCLKTAKAVASVLCDQITALKRGANERTRAANNAAILIDGKSA